MPVISVRRKTTLFIRLQVFLRLIFFQDSVEQGQCSAPSEISLIQTDYRMFITSITT